MITKKGSSGGRKSKDKKGGGVPELTLPAINEGRNSAGTDLEGGGEDNMKRSNTGSLGEAMKETPRSMLFYLGKTMDAANAALGRNVKSHGSGDNKKNNDKAQGNKNNATGSTLDRTPTRTIVDPKSPLTEGQQYASTHINRQVKEHGDKQYNPDRPFFYSENEHPQFAHNNNRQSRNQSQSPNLSQMRTGPAAFNARAHFDVYVDPNYKTRGEKNAERNKVKQEAQSAAMRTGKGNNPNEVQNIGKHDPHNFNTRTDPFYRDMDLAQNQHDYESESDEEFEYGVEDYINHSKGELNCLGFGLWGGGLDYH